MTSILRKIFLFLVVRAARNRLAALAATLLALMFGRRLMREATAARTAHRPTAANRDADRRRRILDGEYRRID